MITFAAVLVLALAQDAPTSPWRADIDAARMEAKRDGKPCVLLLRSDLSAH